MKQVLSVGQCSMDHGSLSRYLKSNFDVEIVPVATVLLTALLATMPAIARALRIDPAEILRSE